MATSQLDDVDFAVAAFRHEGEWRVDELTHEMLDGIEHLADALRTLAGDGGAIALIGRDDDDFLLIRVDENVRLLLSDTSAAEEWELAESALEHLALALDDDGSGPAGDFAILADLGVSESDLVDLVDDDELYVDELLSEIADQLGFGDEFDDAVGLDDE